MSRVVLVAPGAVVEARVRELLGDDDFVDLAPAAPEDVVARLVQLDERPELIVFGDHMPVDHALAVAAASRGVADGMAILSDLDDINSRAKASGITEIIGSTPELDELESLFARARVRSATTSHQPARGPARKVGRVVAITAPKGGVGKTTIACNVALGLAAIAPGDVVIVDLDLQFGDVATALGLDPRRSIADAVARSSVRDAALLALFLTEHPRGLKVLAAPRSPVAADTVTPRAIGHLLRQLASLFSYVVVDTSPGLSEHTVTVIENATDLVSITSMDVSSARGLRTELELLNELDLVPVSHHAVLNFSDRASGMSVSDVEKVVGHGMDVVLPRTRAVSLATNRGVPVIVDSPRDAAARGIRLLVQRLHPGLTRTSWRLARRKEHVS